MDDLTATGPVVECWHLVAHAHDVGEHLDTLDGDRDVDEVAFRLRVGCDCGIGLLSVELLC